MKRVPEEIYNRIDNDIYNLEGDKWWQPDFSLKMIRAVINPFRAGYGKGYLTSFDKMLPTSELCNFSKLLCNVL